MPSRAWTDPFSNHTELASVSIRDDLEAIAGLGGTPPNLLMPLLHEATHHWCFFSPVGNAIALVKSRARRRAQAIAADLDSGAPTTTSNDDLLLDIVTYKVATEALRPFGEGLAVAAELDSLTRKSPFVSAPFVAAARAFAPPSSPDLIASFAELDRVLILARKGSAGVRRKLNVYADRVGPSGQGYLLGYLAVRSIMRRLGAREARFLEESDLVVSFLRSFIYDDLQLVDTLLERNTDYVSLANTITHYIGDKIAALRRVSPEEVKEFETHYSTDSSWNQPRSDTSMSTVLHYDPELGRRGVVRGQQLVADIENLSNQELKTKSYGSAQVLDSIDNELIGTRHLVFLGTCEVDVHVSGGECTVQLDGKTILSGLRTTAQDIAGPGTIDVLYNTRSKTQDRLVVVAVPDGIVSVITYGPTIDPQELPDISMSRSDLRSQVLLFDNLLDAVADFQFDFELKKITAQLPRVVESLYLDSALMYVHDEHLDRTLSLLRTGGVRAVLNGDYDLAQSLAIAGAVCSGAPLRIVAEGELQRQGMPTQLLDRLLTLSSQGMPLMEATGNWLLPVV